MNRSFYLSICFMLCFKLANAQEASVETQYFINKWIYNPAQFESEEAIVSLSYKSQWIGFEGAPYYGRFGVQNYQLGSGYFGFLLKQLTDGPLNEYEAMASYGYQANFSEQFKLNFGLSLGYGIQTADITKLTDPGDPGLINLPDNQGYFQGSFGLSLDFGNASFGASVPRLFDQFVTGGEVFKATTPQLFFFSGSYMIHASTKYSFEPQFLYHMNNNVGVNQIEVMGTLYYDKKVWFGGAYREKYGVSAFAGASINKFDFSYIYTLPSIASVVNQPSHELVLRYRFRKNTNTKSAKSRVGEYDPYDINNYLNSSEEGSEVVEDVQTQDEKATGILVTDVENDDQYKLKPGFYVVMGQFYLKNRALRLRNVLASQGIAGKVIYLHDADIYYMYSEYFSNEQEAEVKLEEAKTLYNSTDPWIYQVK